MDLAPIYLQRLGITAELVGNVKADQLADTTPCEGFDVRSLLNHLIGGVVMFAKGAKGEQMPDIHTAIMAGIPDFVGAAGDDAAAAFAPVVAEANEAWSIPQVAERTFTIGDGMPGKAALRVALLEAVVHGWDIAKASNQAYEIPDMLAVPMLDGLRKGLGDGDRPAGGSFAPAVPVPEDAPAADKLIAFTGRTP